MRLSVLGPLELIDDDGRVIAIPGRKERAFLTVLAISANRVVSEESLVDLLWGEAAPAGALGSLRSFASRVRKLLPVGATLEHQPPGYVLRIPAGSVDVDDVERTRREAADASARGDHGAAADLLTVAASRWRGTALAELAGTAEAEVARLGNLRLAVEEERVEALLASGRHADALDDLDRLCAENPYREHFWRQHMVALYRSGRQTEALRTFATLRRLLGDDLGLEPSPETRELEARLLAHDDDAPAATSSPVEEPAGFDDLPEGVVTFLLTDIEGSTRLWEEHSALMGPVLARHDSLIEAAVTRSGGRLLKTRGEGDSTFSVFHRASDALNAAVATQRALTKEQWPPGIELRVRAALHAGEVALHEGDYRGRAVNRAARLRAVAHGGQTVVSETAARLAGDALPEPGSLRPLGRHRLADLPDPEEVFQLCHPDLPSEFPPLRSLDDVRHNLPAARTSFVGRDAELTAVREQLAANRLVTLVGSGGAGKTRLAIEAARSLIGSYPAGPWLVELAPVGDPDLVAEAVAAAVGVPSVGAGSSAATARLVDHLQRVPTVIVLDNCEQVVQACAELADALLRQCNDVRLLATSRETLGVPGEVSYRVPSLAVGPEGSPVDILLAAPAVRLFADRARAARPSFVLDADNAETIASICRQLDGIPLALELGAALARALPIEEVSRRMDDRFRLLRAGSRTSLPRQQTLQALVDWSHQLLSDPERIAWRRLSVFASGFTIDSAELVCADEQLSGVEVLDLVFRLVDKSIVVAAEHSDDTRFRLNETVRLFGRDRLVESGEAAAVFDRHLAWVAALVRDAEPHLVRVDQRLWLERLEAEGANIRSALGWGIDTDPGLALDMGARLWRFWEAMGAYAEGREHLERATAAVPDPTVAAIEAWHGIGMLCVRSRMFEDGLEAFVRCGEVAAALRDRRGEGVALAGTALCLHNFQRADAPAALRSAEDAVAIFREVGDDVMLARALFTLGNLRKTTDDDDGARAAYEETVEVGRAAGNLVMEGFGLNNLGLMAEVESGDLEEALSWYQRSLRRFCESGNRWGISMVGCNLLQTAIRLGDRVLAEQTAATTEALLWSVRHGVVPSQAVWAAALAVRRGWTALARQSATVALAAARAAGDSGTQAGALAVVALADLRDGNREGAARGLGEILDLLDRDDDRDDEVDAGTHVGELLARLGHQRLGGEILAARWHPDHIDEPVFSVPEEPGYVPLSQALGTEGMEALRTPPRPREQILAEARRLLASPA